MNLRYENAKLSEGFTHVIGCDEVGRGCLAGPVVAAVVVLPQQVESEKFKVIKSANIRDSKLLNAKQREVVDGIIRKNCVAFGIGAVSEKEIDKMNIHNASLLAMKKALQNLLFSNSYELENRTVFVAVDGKFAIPEISYGQEAVIGGDNKILSIAAASIVAKVYRDALMKKLHVKFPEYGFEAHKGYATLHHRQALEKFGLASVHRVSFCGKYV